MTFEGHNLSVTSKGTLPRVPFDDIKEKILGKNYDLSIAFVSPTEARKINMQYRKKKYTPNTLSFSLTKKSGEIIMCLSQIKKEYKKFGMTYKIYLKFLAIHSMLHLKGYAHGGTMESKEKQLLKLFSNRNVQTQN